AGDLDGNLADITADRDGTWMQVDDQIVGFCFVPDVYGTSCVRLTATDACGATAEVTACIVTEQPNPVMITCPSPTGTVLCGAGEYCFDVPISGDIVEVITSAGTWADGKLCLHSDDRPFNPVTIIAIGECNSDTCETRFEIDVAEPPMVVCPADQEVFLCDIDTLIFLVEFIDGYGPAQQMSVTEPAFLVFDGSWTVHVPVFEAGSQTFTVTHANPPCEPATCSFTVTATFNTAPEIAASDSTLTTCELEQICIPFWASDFDNNLAEVTASQGTIIWYGDSIPAMAQAAGADLRIGAEGSRDEALMLSTPPDGAVCFTPDTYREYQITLTAVDDCAATDQVTVTVSVNDGNRVTFTDCPTIPEVISYCAPQTFCVPVGVEGTEYTVMSDFGSFENGELCFPVDTSGTYTITLIADAECNSDTCVITGRFDILEPVEVSCSLSDTTVQICDGTASSVLVPVSVFGDADVITVDPATATYLDGMVEVPVDVTGSIAVTVTAVNSCSADSCTFNVHVIVNTPPVVTAAEDTSLVLCELEQICLDYSAIDDEDNIVEIRSSLGVVNGSKVCFTPTAFGDYEIVITATDSCGAVGEDVINVSITEGEYVTFDCPAEPFYYNIAMPDTLRVPVGVTPIDFPITVEPYGSYDPATGELVVYLESQGSYLFTLTADAECNSDTCKV
ncbi:MAG: hypothetical protein KKA42_06595, partial [candidate division Zixibacteria bacterium]|nr:hypothetical protein [candidate division Zixibacteria bacterium]